jgi:hypothetical protein
MFPRMLLVAAAIAAWAPLCASSVEPSSIDVTYTGVTAGATMRVTVNAAECSPLTVTLTIDGKQVTGTITDVPGSVDLDVPAGTQNDGYDLSVTCGSDRWHDSGIVL